MVTVARVLADETNENSKQTIRAKMEQYILRVEMLKGVSAAPAPAPALKKAAAAGDGKAGDGKEDDESKISEAVLKSFSQALLPAGAISKVEIQPGI